MRTSNLRELIAQTGASEYHTSASVLVDSSMRFRNHSLLSLAAGAPAVTQTEYQQTSQGHSSTEPAPATSANSEFVRRVVSAQMVREMRTILDASS